MRKVERKSILVTFAQPATAVSSFSTNLFVPFQPDEVIVRQISMVDAAADSSIFQLTST